MLPKPKDTLGYSDKEIESILIKYKIDKKVFGRAFGVNTVGVAKDGSPRYYVCDVERALWKLGIKDGRYHEWD